MESEEIQENTGRGYNNNEDLGGNLVPENNAQYEGEQGFDQYQQGTNQMAQNEKPEQIGSDNSFHVDRMIDDFSRNEKFEQKVSYNKLIKYYETLVSKYYNPIYT